MATRRQAREWALQMLFALDLNPREPERVFDAFWSRQEGADVHTRAFAEQLVGGIRRHVKELDALISKYAEHWEIHRMAVVDRNVMRMALYEMNFCDEIPPVVSINEAVDIAKTFNTRESGRFVNGILDRARRDMAVPDGEQGQGV